ncbi:hypothetical protein BAOM_3040 [Peribacillus asahii]|uniref:Uncharacterized protein n=1 Tax=Peribacillus asahii TaxID=228899 RepID=A0A3T0KT85_9BACI|nr:hypothetical protein [Peribacillus asahii]AZV43649.1 hypothetical protein BAOM_3040 [Peribacillus asahii]
MNELENTFIAWREILKKQSVDENIIQLFETIFAYMRDKERRTELLKLAIKSCGNGELTIEQLNELINGGK